MPRFCFLAAANSSSFFLRSCCCLVSSNSSELADRIASHGARPCSRSRASSRTPLPASAVADAPIRHRRRCRRRIRRQHYRDDGRQRRGGPTTPSAVAVAGSEGARACYVRTRPRRDRVLRIICTGPKGSRAIIRGLRAGVCTVDDVYGPVHRRTDGRTWTRAVFSYPIVVVVVVWVSIAVFYNNSYNDNIMMYYAFSSCGRDGGRRGTWVGRGDSGVVCAMSDSLQQCMCPDRRTPTHWRRPRAVWCCAFDGTSRASPGVKRCSAVRRPPAPPARSQHARSAATRRRRWRLLRAHASAPGFRTSADARAWPHTIPTHRGPWNQ